MKPLSPIGMLYGGITAARNALYNSGRLRSHDLGARTISIGNITTGGTGKTPLVALVSELLAENGERVCILTRGYGRANAAERVVVSDSETVLADAATGGDEPVELAERLLGKAVIIADRDRVAAAKFALQEFSPTVFVLDDGFQHRRAKRDVDIVCIDATNPFGNGEVIPAGPLRESLHNLKRAHAFVITRTEQADNTTEITAILNKHAPSAPVFYARTAIERIKPFHGTAASENLQYFAFCGIGNPGNFFRSLELNGIDIRGDRAFRDHSSYTVATIKELEAEAAKANANALITTAKDAVKLGKMAFSLPCMVAEIRLDVSPEPEFRSLILNG
ncbi:MAG: tetraacyldisaccharide 4'-kinase [Acidobacteria bacterium]|nr:tetraacyldisaccharide 4'-kinase [Acidobacteriota bacterium]